MSDDAWRWPRWGEDGWGGEARIDEAIRRVGGLHSEHDELTIAVHAIGLDPVKVTIALIEYATDRGVGLVPAAIDENNQAAMDDLWGRMQAAMMLGVLLGVQLGRPATPPEPHDE